MKCKKCGNELNECDLFCHTCGAKVEERELDKDEKININKRVNKEDIQEDKLQDNLEDKEKGDILVSDRRGCNNINNERFKNIKYMTHKVCPDCNAICDEADVNCRCGHIFDSIPHTSFQLTSKPIVLPYKTTGTGGRDYPYVLFGDYPQTLKEKHVIIDDKTMYKVNGWKCYPGNDGYFYAIIKSHTKYGCATLFGDLIDDDNYQYTFSDGSPVVDDKVYYFKMESIKWRVLDIDKDGKALLCCENILLTDYFYKRSSEERKRKIDGQEVDINNYEYSAVRSYLNSLDGSKYDVKDYTSSGFIDEAFNEDAKSLLCNTFIDNSNKQNFPYGEENIPNDIYKVRDTEDKVFILSLNEVSNPLYGFDKYNVYINDNKGTTYSSRLRLFSDYAIATGAARLENIRRGSWWLRSHGSSCSYSGFNVSNEGYGGQVDYITQTATRGIVPCICVKL